MPVIFGSQKNENKLKCCFSFTLRKHIKYAKEEGFSIAYDFSLLLCTLFLAHCILQRLHVDLITKLQKRSAFTCIN